MAIPALLHLPPWTVNYNYDVRPDQTRTPVSGAFKRQAKRSHRNIVTASVTRRLKRLELPFWEGFVNTILVDGSLKFTDVFADSNGLVTGTIRLVDGAYSVTSDTLTHTVTATIEIFR